MKIKPITVATVLAVMLSSAGCSSYTLNHTTLNQAATITDIQYQIVLDNLAMLKSNPGALPWQVKLGNGTISAANEVASTGSYTGAETLSATPSHTITRLLSVVPKTNVTQGWTITPVIDPEELQKLRLSYDQIVDQPWVHSDGSPTAGARIGNYRGATIWVDKSDLRKLSDATLLVLGAAPPSPLEKALAPFTNSLR